MAAKEPNLSACNPVLQFIGAALLAGLLTGCDTTRTTVPLTLIPFVNQPVKTPATASVEVAPVKDSRTVTDGLMLVHKMGRDGKPLPGAYVTEKPFAEIFRDALNATLQKNGFQTASGTPYALESELASLDYGEADLPPTIASLTPAVDTFRSTISVHFELKDKATGASVWKRMYQGEAKARTAWETGTFLAQTCSQAAGDVVRQLITDPKFRGFFENQNTNAP